MKYTENEFSKFLKKGKWYKVFYTIKRQEFGGSEDYTSVYLENIFYTSKKALKEKLQKIHIPFRINIRKIFIIGGLMKSPKLWYYTKHITERGSANIKENMIDNLFPFDTYEINL